MTILIYTATHHRGTYIAYACAMPSDGQIETQQNPPATMEQLIPAEAPASSSAAAPKHRCERCHKEYPRFSELKRHAERVNKCEAVYSDIDMMAEVERRQAQRQRSRGGAAKRKRGGAAATGQAREPEPAANDPPPYDLYEMLPSWMHPLLDEGAAAQRQQQPVVEPRRPPAPPAVAAVAPSTSKATDEMADIVDAQNRTIQLHNRQLEKLRGQMAALKDAVSALRMSRHHISAFGFEMESHIGRDVLEAAAASQQPADCVMLVLRELYFNDTLPWNRSFVLPRDGDGSSFLRRDRSTNEWRSTRRGAMIDMLIGRAVEVVEHAYGDHERSEALAAFLERVTDGDTDEHARLHQMVDDFLLTHGAALRAVE